MSMLHLDYQVPGDDFTRAGEASGDVKHKLKKLGYEPDAIRRVSIAMYEGEINMVIHAGGGEAVVDIDPDRVDILLTDHGPGIKDVEQAMQAGWSTAPDNVRALGFGASQFDGGNPPERPAQAFHILQGVVQPQRGPHHALGHAQRVEQGMGAVGAAAHGHPLLV